MSAHYYNIIFSRYNWMDKIQKHFFCLISYYGMLMDNFNRTCTKLRHIRECLNLLFGCIDLLFRIPGIYPMARGQVYLLKISQFTRVSLANFDP